MARETTEWIFSSAKPYKDPFNEIELDVIIRDAQGRRTASACFLGGRSGVAHALRRRCRGPLYVRNRLQRHVQCGFTRPARNVLEVAPYDGANPLLRRGHAARRIRTAATWSTADGTPFFWLADTWWMGLTKRLRWPADFERLTADRAGKGFTVVQIVAGLYPDMPQFDARGANEAGFPWDGGLRAHQSGVLRYGRPAHPASGRSWDCAVHRRLLGILSAYPGNGQDEAPLAIPDCALGRTIRRSGAWPAKEPCLTTCPRTRNATAQCRSAAGPNSPVMCAPSTPSIIPLRFIHPSSARNTVEDASVLDFDMLQTGHSDRASIPNTVKLVTGFTRGRARPCR